MVKTDYIPTVKSLIDQGAIAVSGNEELIREFSEFIYFKGFHFNVSELNFDCGNLGYLEIDDRYNCSELLSKSPRSSQSIGVLYSLDLSGKISLTVHRNNDQRDNLQLMFVANAGDIEHRETVFEKIYDLLDNSEYFYVCQQCNQLVDSRLIDISDIPVCAAGSCTRTLKQTFDVNQIDRVTSSRFDEIRVAIFEDEIRLFNSTTFWPHPHECHSGYAIKATLPLSASPAEVRELKTKIESEHKYPADCFYCKGEVHEGMGMSRLVNDSIEAITCYACATEHHGVIY